MNKEISSRQGWIDIARGICIICMIATHQFDWSQRNYWFNDIAGTWFLVFFFFCSGLCFSDKYSLKDYIKRQAKKLLLPYVAVTTFYLAYRLYYGLWWDIDTVSKGISTVATLLYCLPIDITLLSTASRSIYTIGVGPIWFLPCLFFASVLYKLVAKRKGKTLICIALALCSSISQTYIVLPFAIQSSIIGCMYIALGVFLKKQVSQLVNRFREQELSMNIILVGVLFVLHYVVRMKFPMQILNLGGNTYSMFALAGSMTGFAFLISLSIAIEKTRIWDEFLAFCGRESFLIVIFHTLDILMLRKWAMRGNSFLIGTILLYPFMIYSYRRIEQVIKCWRNGKEIETK